MSLVVKQLLIALHEVFKRGTDRIQNGLWMGRVRRGHVDIQAVSGARRRHLLGAVSRQGGQIRLVVRPDHGPAVGWARR